MGNVSGGIKARDKFLARDPDYYRKLGSLGGRAGDGANKGFASKPRSFVVEAGRRGGTISSRKGIRTGEGKSRSTLYKRQRAQEGY